ncbi:MAG: hypothetical protein R2715_12545 [Ilumatobacteraceae bacterium]
MKAVVLYESLTGNTRKAGELIADKLQTGGNRHHRGVFGALARPRGDPGRRSGHRGDLSGVVRRRAGGPWNLGALRALPAMAGKQVATYCTFALNLKNSLDKMAIALESRGGQVIGGLALHRSADEHTDTSSTDCSPASARRLTAGIVLR